MVHFNEVKTYYLIRKLLNDSYYRFDIAKLPQLGRKVKLTF